VFLCVRTIHIIVFAYTHKHNYTPLLPTVICKYETRALCRYSAGKVVFSLPLHEKSFIAAVNDRLGVSGGKNVFKLISITNQSLVVED